MEVSEKARERVVYNNLKKNSHKHKMRKEVVFFFHRNLVKERNWADASLFCANLETSD